MPTLPVDRDDDIATGDTWGKWGVAHKRRGMGYSDLAKTFVAQFPVGSHISNEDFDSWAQAQEMLTVPATEASKNSDAWLAHLQRRHQCRTRINNAATHPRMVEEGSTPFILVAIHGGLEVQSPQVAASSTGLPRKVSSLIKTKRKQLSYLMQSADWAVLPAHEQAIAEAIYDDIDAFTVDTKIAADRISHKLVKLQHRIKQLMDAGSVVPRNGGLRQLMLPSTEEGED